VNNVALNELHAPVTAMYLPSSGCVDETFAAVVTASVCNEDASLEAGNNTVVAAVVDDVLNADVDSKTINITQ